MIYIKHGRLRYWEKLLKIRMKFIQRFIDSYGGGLNKLLKYNIFFMATIIIYSDHFVQYNLFNIISL